MKGFPVSENFDSRIYGRVVLKFYNFIVLNISNRLAWGCSTRSVLLPFFQENFSDNHLDAGVGSGYYLERMPFKINQSLTLLDKNEVCLSVAKGKLKKNRPEAICEDLLSPVGRLGNKKFKSISLFYVLHCLQGGMSVKSRVFDYLKRHLDEGGVLYGATILGYEAIHNKFGYQLMRFYNKKKIFCNGLDSAYDLTVELNAHFSEVVVKRVGRVAIFSVRHPKI